MEISNLSQREEAFAESAMKEVMEPYELHYTDLLSLSSSSSSSSSSSIDTERLESITRAVMEALGPTGSGLITITGVPNVAELRNSLLLRARDLSLLNHHHRNRILKVSFFHFQFLAIFLK